MRVYTATVHIDIDKIDKKKKCQINFIEKETTCLLVVTAPHPKRPGKS